MRLDGLLTADSQSRELPMLEPGDQEDGVTLNNIYVRKPNGDSLIDDLNLDLAAGDAHSAALPRRAVAVHRWRLGPPRR
ncbi:ABC transporter ATP-binding protein [Mycobacteroides abscessus subsp. abscessus]|nr:ABC transporter ATP-binding protein [Mycobacteroides abscessus subsp. abscessus]